MNTIWTIGHSSRTLEDFVELLKTFRIELLVDVRRYPGSRKFPYFNKDALAESLPQEGIAYKHIESLGGRRKVLPNSKNDAWRLDSFRGYADYMETEEFKSALEELEELAKKKRTAFMCSEAVWWSCHRSLVSDALKVKGWEVFHIMGSTNAPEHPYTKPAHVENGKLDYKKVKEE